VQKPEIRNVADCLECLDAIEAFAQEQYEDSSDATALDKKRWRDVHCHTQAAILHAENVASRIIKGD
jgi:hypothetical protein